MRRPSSALKLVVSLLVVLFCCGSVTAFAADSQDVHSGDTLTSSVQRAGVTVLTDPISGKDVAFSTPLQTLAAGDPDISWYDDSLDSFTLTKAEQFLGLSVLVNQQHKDFTGKTVTLAATVSGAPVTPIGTAEHPFNGTFDGGYDRNNSVSYMLSNLTVNATSKSYVGIFGYTGPDSSIRNLWVYGGTLSIDEQAAAGAQISDVGSIAGYMGGDIDNCVSSMNISITSEREATTDIVGNVCRVGGLVGYLAGDMQGCARDISDIAIASDSDILENMRYLAGEIGGLVGAQGDTNDIDIVPTINDSLNKGKIIMTLTGAGGKDRFGEQLFSVSACVGGIVGATTGSVYRCTNEGEIQTSSQDDQYDDNRRYTAGRGASNTGGIVGMLRGNSFEDQATKDQFQLTSDPGNEYWAESDGTATPPIVGVYDCFNQTEIAGLSSVGGIVGGSGSFTEIEGCGNTGKIFGCRWNKPYAAGIIGNSRGDVRYCYNRGLIYSVTGAGYYCAGIAGGISNINTVATEDHLRVPTLEMTGCYTTGAVYTSATGYRSGILAGESNSYIHDNVYAPNLTKDDKVVDDDTGTVINNSKLSVSDLKGSVGIAKLNVLAAGNGDWEIFYLPFTGSDPDNNPAGLPVLSRTDRSVADAVDIAAATPSLKANARYSASRDPIPDIRVVFNSNELIQNADYYVVPQSGARAVAEDSTPYSATIVGMGKYYGTLSSTLAYGIDKGDIGSCTIVAAPALFNWERQQPSWVKLVDSAGNEVQSDEYTWQTCANEDGSTVAVDGKYFDYINAHGPGYKYDIVATASADSNYAGSTTQAAFRINWVDMMQRKEQSDPNAPQADTAMYDKVIWDDPVTGQHQEWNYLDVMSTDDDATTKDGSKVQIVYTGQPITPTVNSVTYLDREMRLAEEGTPYWDSPFDYDYKYVYGNPNPEENSATGEASTNVTSEGEPSCMTTRFTTGGNFRGYSNVFFKIVPASLDRVEIEPVSALPETGSALTPDVKMTYNGMTLVNGRDYELSYQNNLTVGVATITVTGKGNYTGSKTVNFDIDAAYYRSLSGDTRIETAILCAKEAYPDGTDTVILAYSGNYPDALSATALAGMLDAPILLSSTVGLPDVVGQAITELKAQKVVIVGGTSVLGPEVEADLVSKLGQGNVTRLAGVDRLTTNIDIYNYGKAQGVWSTTAVIASGANFPDALSISPYAACGKNPLFLTTATGALTDVAQGILTTDYFSRVIIVGGTGVIPSETEAWLKSKLGANNVIRLGGDDRYATSDQIARWLVGNAKFTWDGACIASGTAFPDSLTGSVIAAKNAAPMLLAATNNLTTVDTLGANADKVGHVYFLGGTGAVPQSIRDTVLQMLGLT